MGNRAHILLLVYPMQGHINPTMHFAKCLIRLGAKVTIATTISGQRLIHKNAAMVPRELSITAISDGYDDGIKNISANALMKYGSNLRKTTSENLTNIITNSSEDGIPITCIVYGLLQSWVIEVARSYNIAFALFWINQATVLNIYSNYFNCYEDVIKEMTNNLLGFVEIPGLPRLASRDLPSFMLPNCPPMFSSVLPSMKEQIKALDADKKPTILVNTFEELELETLKVIQKYNMVAIGPLIPSTLLDKNDQSGRPIDDNLFQERTSYFEWLNSKTRSSVIYVSFGSMLELPKEQVEEIAYGLLESERPFLWVILERGQKGKEDDYPISCIEELRKRGMIVPWCSQLQVLSHPSVGCFITHCGWNSTLESLVMGVPVVAFPQWADQPTNAKMIEDVWKTGVRVGVGGKAKDGKEIVDREEVKRCIKIVMDEEKIGKELKRNAMNWKKLAKKAVMDGGSSDVNLKAFVKEVGGMN